MSQNVSSIFGMLSPEERQYLQDYAAKEYTAQGAIVDLGCWLGVSTVALAIGLSDNPQLAGKPAVIHAYDCFLWESWMDQFVAGTPLEGKHQPRESFYVTCQEQVAPWQDYICLYEADLRQTIWQGGAIELLFIDAMKSWDLLNSIMHQFFPALIPGQSIVVQQDFSHFGTYWIHLLMYRLREYFQPVYDIPNSWSLAFRNIAPIPQELLQQTLSLASFDRTEIDAAFAYSRQIVSASKQAQIIGAKTIALLDLREINQAQQELTQACVAGLSKADLELPLSLGLASLVLTYLTSEVNNKTANSSPETVVANEAQVLTPSTDALDAFQLSPQPPLLQSEPASAKTADLIPETLAYTGERHMAGQVGVDLSLSHIDHMVRYALAAQFVAGQRVLDITCGSGYGSQFIAIQGAREVVGVDIDADAINYACKYHQHPAVSYRVGDAHALVDLETASFDVIVSFETIEHLQRPREFLIELRRLLKPGGQLFLSCPNDYRISPWVSEYHLHKFHFHEFRDLIVSVFEPTVFMGQYYGATSSLIKPIALSDTFCQFSAYRQPLAVNFFGQQYLDAIPSLNDAIGYLAIVGVESSHIANQMSISLKAFQNLMELIYYDKQSIQNYLQQIQQLQSDCASYQQLQSDCASYQQLQSDCASYQQQIVRLQDEVEQLQGIISAKKRNWFASGYQASRKAILMLLSKAK